MPSLKLLIVEDDAANLDLMNEVFTSLKAEVCAVGESEKAAALITRQRFDGIFLDLSMPAPNGFQLAELIRNSPSNKTTPIVVVTGIDEKQVMRQAFSTGATFFLQKPIDRQKLTRLFLTVRGGMLDNRRRYIRVPLRAAVNLISQSRKIKAQSWNLSEGGMQVEADGLCAGAAVHLSFRLPGEEFELEPEGVVAWAQEHRQGIQFTAVSTRDRTTIKKFIAALGS